MKVLYIYPGVEQGTNDPSRPATQRYGYQHMKSLGISADFIGRDDALPVWLRKSFLGKLIGFKLRHALLFFKARNYDIVFGAALVYLMPLKKIFGGKARYVVLNIELVRMLRANAHRPVRSRIIKTLFKEFSVVICLAHVQKEWLLAQCPFLEGKVHVIPLGADTEFFVSTFESRGNTVLSVGGDSGRDYVTLFKTAELLPSMQFEVICGRRNLVGVPHVPSNVRLYHNMPFAELREKYQSAALIVIATHDDSYTDGADCSGQTVLLDAMASGLPIIATRKAYLADYVREGEDALITDSGNSETLAQTIERLQGDADLRTRLAQNARTRAEKEFSTKAMAEGLASIFTST